MQQTGICAIWHFVPVIHGAETAIDAIWKALEGLGEDIGDDCMQCIRKYIQY